MALVHEYGPSLPSRMIGSQQDNLPNSSDDTSFRLLETKLHLARDRHVVDSNSTETSIKGSSQGRRNGHSPTKRGYRGSTSRARGHYAGRGRGRGRWAAGRDRDSPEPPPKVVMTPEERVLLNHIRTRQSELKRFYNVLGTQQMELLEELSSRSLSRLGRKSGAHTVPLEYAAVVNEIEERTESAFDLAKRRYDIEAAAAEDSFKRQRELIEVQTRQRIGQARVEHLKGSQGDLVIFQRSHRLAMDETRTDAGSDIASYPRYHELPEPDVQFVRGYTSCRVNDERAFQIRQANYDEQARRDVIDDEIVSPVRQADRHAAEQAEELTRREDLLRHLVQVVGTELDDLHPHHLDARRQDPDAPQFNLSRLADVSEQVARDPGILGRLRTSSLSDQRPMPAQLPIQPQLEGCTEFQHPPQSRPPPQVSMASSFTDGHALSAYPDLNTQTPVRRSIDGPPLATRKNTTGNKRTSRRKATLKHSVSKGSEFPEESGSTASSNDSTPLPIIAPAPLRPVLIQPAPVPQNPGVSIQQARITPSQSRPGPTTMAAILNPAPPSTTPPRLETKPTFTMIHPQVHEHFLLPASSRPHRPPSPKSEDPGRRNPASTAFSAGPGPQPYHIPHARHSSVNHPSQLQMLPPFQKRAPFAFDSSTQGSNHLPPAGPFAAAVPRLPLPHYLPADRNQLPANQTSQFLLRPSPSPLARAEQGLPALSTGTMSSKFNGVKSVLAPSSMAAPQPTIHNHQSKFSVPGYGPPRTRALNTRRGSGQITFTPTQTPNSSRFKPQPAPPVPSTGTNGFHDHGYDGHEGQLESTYHPSFCSIAMSTPTEVHSSVPPPIAPLPVELSRSAETDANTLAGQNGRRLLLPKR